VTVPGRDALAAEALDFWRTERDLLLQGLVHALSNRVGTLVAVAGMLDPGAPAAGPAVPILQGEVDRLERLLGEFRALAGETPGGGGGEEGADGVEPLHLSELVSAVVALHVHHPTQREVPCTVDLPSTLLPARARPGDVAQALLLALAAVKAGAVAVAIGEATAAPGMVALRFGAVGQAGSPAGSPWRTLAGMPGTPAERQGWAVACAGWLLAGSGGSARADGAAVVVELPGLGARG
jgi:hypothetical protein